MSELKFHKLLLFLSFSWSGRLDFLCFPIWWCIFPITDFKSANPLWFQCHTRHLTVLICRSLSMTKSDVFVIFAYPSGFVPVGASLLVTGCVRDICLFYLWIHCLVRARICLLVQLPCELFDIHILYLIVAAFIKQIGQVFNSHKDFVFTNRKKLIRE